MNRALEAEIFVDSFAGGGGASKGMELALGRGPDIAINHDAEAIALHAANHPETKHYCEDVWKVDPVKAVAGRRVGLMWLSPDCKHFSKAKGGKPVSKRVRGLAWVAVRWAAAVRPRVLVLENVEEFQGWGPVSRDTDRPDPEQKGKTFKAFVRRLRALGYVVDWRELRACDYGAPTIRKRLFLVARCDGQPIVWPTPTHGKGRALPWRTAAECIDFALECPSIFERKKALADNTLRRIAAGLKRFVFEADRPFIIGVGGRMAQSPPRSLSQPYQTITAKADAAIVTPYIVPTAHNGDARAHSLGEPLRTVTGAHRGDHAIVEPFLIPIDNGSNAGGGAASVEAPLSTITTEARHVVIAPTLIQTGYGEREGQAPRAPGLEKPLGTVVAGGAKHALVAGFLAKHYGGHETPGSQLGLPIGTLTTQDHHHLVSAHIQRDFGQSVGHSMDTPMATVTGGAGGHLAEVRAFLVAYYGAEKGGGSLFDPMRTLSTKDRFGLVTVEGIEYALADIGMRMLQPRELYRAQGFPDSYRIDIEFKGKPLSKTAQVRMCGNSVCPDVAAAIITANVGARDVEKVA